jgi:hypothetical protein
LEEIHMGRGRDGLGTYRGAAQGARALESAVVAGACLLMAACDAEAIHGSAERCPGSGGAETSAGPADELPEPEPAPGRSPTSRRTPGGGGTGGAPPDASVAATGASASAGSGGESGLCHPGVPCNGIYFCEDECFTEACCTLLCGCGGNGLLTCKLYCG